MLIQNKFSRKTKLLKQTSLTHLIFLVVLLAASTLQGATQNNIPSSQQASTHSSPSNMVKVGLTDIPEKENFSLEYFIRALPKLNILVQSYK
ncbi:MAG: hypothetical protein BGO68_03795 [Candidatus Amoebophilus sp. 36-38]|nr:MAG: hypothetical protein BGO68_03795 [Candidatus Amoebophilus sp. 36-38]